MRLEDKHINQFIELYLKKYGVVLERAEATQMAIRFASCIRVVESNSFIKQEENKYGQ